MKSTTIQAGAFKAKCLQLMDEVHDKHISIVITKHGVPVAQLVPVQIKSPVNFFGCLKDTVTINQDIIAPLETEWEENE